MRMCGWGFVRAHLHPGERGLEAVVAHSDHNLVGVVVVRVIVIVVIFKQ